MLKLSFSDNHNHKNSSLIAKYVLSAIIALFLAGCGASSSINNIPTTSEVYNNTDYQSLESKSKEIDNSKVEISLEDAVSIGYNAASEYFENLQLTEVHSYDNDHFPNINAGSDGKREWWYVNFANNKGNYVNVLICDGEVDIIEPFDSNGNNGLFSLTELNFTSSEAVNKAKEIGLRGGDPASEEEWISGYNFKLEYSSLVDDPNSTMLFFEVIGISPNGNFAHVDFNALTGEILLAEEEVSYDNGDVEWKSFL